MKLNIVVSIAIVALSFFALIYVNRLAKRDPRAPVSVYESYIESFYELSGDGCILSTIKISDILISEHRIIVKHTQVSGGLWGALANSTSKYKAGYNNEYMQCKLHYKCKSDRGITIQGETPYISISEIKLLFILEGVNSVGLVYKELDDGSIQDSKLDLSILKNHL